ncbi:MAG: hypothetical protein ACPLKZ_00980 [Candidatus Bathyarchaeales archaeon]
MVAKTSVAKNDKGAKKAKKAKKAKNDKKDKATLGAVPEPLVLSAVCVCGATYTAVVDLPFRCELSDDKGNVYSLRLAEHVIVKCPRCNRLLNVGNGSKRETEPQEKDAKGISIQEPNCEKNGERGMS